jgi:hypothetical protein
MFFSELLLASKLTALAIRNNMMEEAAILFKPYYIATE